MIFHQWFLNPFFCILMLFPFSSIRIIKNSGLWLSSVSWKIYLLSSSNQGLLLQLSSHISGKTFTEKKIKIEGGKKEKKTVSSLPKFLWPLREMDGTERSCNEHWLQCYDISITSLFGNFSLPCSNDVCGLLFPLFTLWFIRCYWGLSLFTVTVFLLSLSKDDFMIMSSLWVCSKFFVASILQHYFSS